MDDEKLWEMVAEHGRSYAMYHCFEAGYTPNAAYWELYGESPYELDVRTEDEYEEDFSADDEEDE